MARTSPRAPRAGTGVLLSLAAAVALATGGCSDAAHHSSTSDSTAVTTTSLTTTTATFPTSSTTTTTTAPAQAPRVDDGSLGVEAVRLACRLLSRAQIRAQFGGPVSVPTPTYPYCQWLVGSDAFLALAVEPDTTFDDATQYVTTLETIPDLGSQAIIANNRFLYFSSGTTSYWLLWQQVGDFSELHTTQLVALARAVLQRKPRRALWPPPLPVPPGPPIYFAGDSTAAGPEWAWDAYHVTSPRLRTLAEYEVGSGLVASGFFDWQRHLLAVVAARRPKLVIYMGSANDGQELEVDGAYQSVGSRLWDKAYGERVGEIMSALVAEGAKVLWIGEPAMQDPQLSAYMTAMDAVCAEQAAKHPGVTFFNPGTVLNGPGGSYSPTRMIDGQAVSVRLDGVHLNMAGSIYLADYIAAYVARLLPPAVARAPAARAPLQVLRSEPAAS